MKPIFAILFLFIPILLPAQIQLLNDEFDDSATKVNWDNISQSENWGFEQLRLWDIDSAFSSQMTLIPHTSSWFGEYRGSNIYKLIDGNFALTTQVTVTDTSMTGIPSSTYSLAGVILRRPLTYPTGGPIDWQPNEQDYVFLSLGYAATNHPSCAGCPPPHLEVKTTNNSNSNLRVASLSTQTARIRMVRVNNFILVLYQIPGSDWQVHERYYRPDMSGVIQAGFFAYTDWPKVSVFSTSFHNENLLVPGVADPNPGVAFNPDLIGRFDYARYDPVTLPTHLEGVNLLDETAVPDSALLAFLGYESTPHCPKVFTVVDSIMDGHIVYAHADSILNIHHTLSDSSVANYWSGTEVNIDSNFHIELGSELSVSIGSCP